MNTKHKCTSLELSQALDKAGVKLSTEFYWAIHGESANAIIIEKNDLRSCTFDGHPFYETFVSAPLPCELLEVLPKEITKGNRIYVLEINLFYGDVGYKSINRSMLINIEDTLPNALAKLLLKLIEEKLVEV